MHNAKPELNTDKRFHAQEYYGKILPTVLAILSPEGATDTPTPPPESHKKAAAFSISRMLTVQPIIASQALASILHAPFSPQTKKESHRTDAVPSLETLEAIFARSDPSPLLPKHLLSPIVPSLYALLAQIDHARTADPSLKETVRGLLRIWARTIDVDEAVMGWWLVVNSGDGWGHRDDVYWDIIGMEARVYVGRWAPICSCVLSF